METNDSRIPGVVRGAANRLDTDYISLAPSFFVFPLCFSLSHARSLSVSNSFDVMETLQAYLAKPLAAHEAFSTETAVSLVFCKGGSLIHTHTHTH